MKPECSSKSKTGFTYNPIIASKSENGFMKIRRFFKSLRDLLMINAIDLFPLRKSLLNYSKDNLKGDLKAGINVTLLTFPTAMAYALIAGLPIEYGLYGAMVGTIMGACFTGSHFVNLGPTNATAALLMSSFSTLYISTEKVPQYLPILALLVGCFLLLGAFLNVANLVQYISRSVIFGYVTAISIQLIANQTQNLLGYHLRLSDEGPTTLFDVCKQTFLQISEINWQALYFGLLTFIFYYSFKSRLRRWPYVALTIFVVSLIACFVSQFWPLSIQFLSAVDASHWKITMPNFSFDAISLMAGPAFGISFLCLLDGTTISKSLAARLGQKPDVNQVIFGLGISNIACGFLNGMPASGSLIRSALNYTSGAKTPLAGMFTGLLCFCGIICFGPLFHFIPRPALAAVIVCLGIELINRHAIGIIIASTRSDAVVFFITLIAGLLVPLNVAIYTGVFTSIVLFLRKAAAPEFHEYTFDEIGNLSEIPSKESSEHPEISIVHIEGSLFFAASELFRDQIRQVCERTSLQVIILKMRNALHIDATCIMSLEELLKYMQSKNRLLILAEVRPPVLKILKNSGLLYMIGVPNIFADNRENPTLSTAKALKYAKEKLGEPKPQIRIVTKEVKSSTPYAKVKASIRTLVNPLQKNIRKIKETDEQK